MSFDIIVALIIIGVALLIFIIFQIGALPKSCHKSIFFILGSLGAVFGVSLFARRRLKLLNNELKQKEERLKAKEKELEMMKDNYQLSEKELNLMKAKLAEQLDAYRKLMLQIDANTKQEKERIDKLGGEDLHHEFIAVFGE